MQVALAPLFSFLVISWWCGLLLPCVRLYPVLCLMSDDDNFCFCAVDVLRLGVSCSSVVAWVYVIRGVAVLAAPLVGGWGVLLGDSRVAIRVYPGTVYNYREFCLSLFVVCCICELV